MSSRFARRAPARAPAGPEIHDQPRRTRRLRDAAYTDARRADGGIIDVQLSSPAPTAFTVTMTGTTAADSYLCCTSTAAQTFHLVQEFEVTCSDPSIRFVTLTLDSSLVGYVRSRAKPVPA